MLPKVYVVLTICFLFAQCSSSQLIKPNEYGLKIISTISQYKASVKDSAYKEMVDIQKMIPNIILDLKYTTANNFVGQVLYPPTQHSYLRKPAAEALQKVQQALNLQNLSLKIWDAYRPYSVTKKMWAVVPDSRYAADPKYGSGHNRGASVDVTLVNLKTGKELDMGTDFDNFSDTAHSTFKNLPASVLNNRAILKNIMEQHGFIVLKTEWWHFYLPNANKFELMNVSFAQLKKMVL